MKRFLVLILAVSLLVPGLAGCGQTAPSGGGTELPNPMAQISLSEFEKDTGFQVDLYEGYELGEVYKINTDPVIYGVGITAENGVQYDVRLAKTDNLVEISGMNYKWTYTNDPEPAEEEVKADSTAEPEEADGTAEAGESAESEEVQTVEGSETEAAEIPKYYFYFTDEGQGMITWYEDGCSWSVSAVEGATKEGMDQMYEDLYGMISY